MEESRGDKNGPAARPRTRVTGNGYIKGGKDDFADNVGNNLKQNSKFRFQLLTTSQADHVRVAGMPI